MKLVHLFINTIGVVLSIAAIAKVISGFGHSAILQTHDPLTGLQFHNLFWLISIIEFAVALFCFFSKDVLLAVGLTSWLATSFLGYRIYLILIGWHRPCPCLGNLTDALHIPPHTAEVGMKIILAYLLIGSYATLFWLWRQRINAEGRMQNDEAKSELQVGG